MSGWRSIRSGSARASGSAAARTAAASRGSSRARTWRRTRCTWCRGMTIRGCCRTRSWPAIPVGSRARRRSKALFARPKTRYRQSDAPCVFGASGPADGQLRTSFRRCPMGRHAGTIGRALSGRCVPGRRDHRIGRDCPACATRRGSCIAHGKVGLLVLYHHAGWERAAARFLLRRVRRETARRISNSQKIGTYPVEFGRLLSSSRRKKLRLLAR